MKTDQLPLRNTPYAIRLTLLAILLLAAFLRFYRLDAQSFWNDEGNSARIAERTLALIVEGAAGDIHPPGYYLLLHYWRALFGQSEFALRSLSVVAGLALVVFTYLLGRRLFGKMTGVIAAFLGAISPFAIYYSQEARMYVFLAALAAASALASCGFRISDRRSWSAALAAYVFTCAVGLYTHYAFSFILLAHNLVFFLRWVATDRRSPLRWSSAAAWFAAQIAILILFLPWAPTALRQVSSWPSARWSYTLASALLEILRSLTMGITISAQESTAALIGAAMFLLIGLWSRCEKTTNEVWSIALSIIGIALYLVLPIALILVFDLYKPAYLKFLLVALPPFHILIARGIENLAQVARGILRPAFIILVAVLSVIAVYPSLHNLYFDPTYARDDYRQLAADIQSSGSLRDAVILNAPNQWEVLTYYYPNQDVYPAPYRPDPAKVEAFLSPLLEQYRRLFVLYWGDAESDPRRLVETWLATHAYKVGDRWYGDVRLATYGVASLPEEPDVALDARFGENIRLRGCALSNAAFGPGDIVPVTLFWEAQAPIVERYKVTVQILDGEGHLVAQVDTEPGDGLVPTTSWQPNQTPTDRYGLFLPSDAPPGRCSLIVALYHLVDGERLSVALNGESAGSHLPLGDIVIELR
jgi:mannosyltransferase